MAKFAELLTFREITEGEPKLDDLHEILRKYRRVDVILLLSALNCLLGTWQNEPQFDQDARLADYFLFGFHQQLQAIRNAGKSQKVVFSRIGILYLMKQSCIACPDTGPAPSTRSAHSDVGLCFLMANDLLLPFVPSPSDDTLRRMANLLPFTDYISHDHYPMEIGRTQIIFDEIAHDPALTGRSDFIDIQSVFQERLGLDHATFCELVFACATKFLNVKLEELEKNPEVGVLRNTFFARSRAPADKVTQFFRKITCAEVQFAEEVRRSKDRPADDLTLFQAYPLIEVLKETYACLDPGFLVEKAGRGLYWTLFFEVPKDERDKLSAFWGAVFELYVNHILRGSYRAGGIFIPDPKFSDGSAAFDACIREERSLLVFEHKSSVIRADAKYGGDAQKLKTELDTKFIEGGADGKKGLAQLSNHLVRFLSGDTLAGIDARDIDRVYPVMVCLESSMVSPFLGHYLNERFREMFRRQAFRQVVTPVFTLGISDLENLLGYLQLFLLTDIFESYHSKNRTMLTSMSSSEVPILKNASPERNMVKERFSKFASQMERSFFGADPTEERPSRSRVQRYYALN